MSTATVRTLRLCSLAAACILLTSACNEKSKALLTKHEPPRVSCKAARSNHVPPAPAADNWVEWVPPSSTLPQGAARLSEPAVVFVTGVLAELAKERALRAQEHACLDRAEEAGDIVQ